MTTIAFDGQILAADGKVVHNGRPISYNIPKLFMGIGDIPVAAMSGSAQCAAAVERALAKGEKPPVGEYDLLCISEQGAVFDFAAQDGFRFYYPKGTPIALGSGGPYALGAMRAGANAIEAVRIAAECDTGTGGTILYYTVSEGYIRTLSE